MPLLTGEYRNAKANRQRARQGDTLVVNPADGPREVRVAVELRGFPKWYGKRLNAPNHTEAERKPERATGADGRMLGSLSTADQVRPILGPEPFGRYECSKVRRTARSGIEAELYRPNVRHRDRSGSFHIIGKDPGVVR